MEDVFSFAKAWFEISGIQGTSGVEYAMMKLYQFPLYLKNEMIFEKMCLPVQYNKRYVLLSLDYLIKPWFDDYSGRNYSYKEYRKAAEYILSLGHLGKLQGPELEKMLLDEMKKKGYDCIYGKYPPALQTLGMGMIKAQKQCYTHI